MATWSRSKHKVGVTTATDQDLTQKRNFKWGDSATAK
eukprot:CAMPEP_0171963034 /NCGR_PEP_ID=MMETSP0993-20121228/172944_1 /TAXON_ID=483369 /ORGANISM="non described non described, Strain CCMP2098" /LENGTH=36 /DNA_ID= /DNA_START= /DNA_END= /DNA_ORIENTATION=